VKAAALAAVVLGLAACGGQSPGNAGPATLEVEQRFEGDVHYIEGSLSYIRLAGTTTVEEQLEDGRAEVRLEAGDYTLHSWQRPCIGNCGFLDQPTDRCSGRFEAKAGVRLHVSIAVRPGKGCSMEIR
jgi:hypothetical protein